MEDILSQCWMFQVVAEAMHRHAATVAIFKVVILKTSKMLSWGCAKGAAKASCGETVVQKSVFGESVSSLPP